LLTIQKKRPQLGGGAEAIILGSDIAQLFDHLISNREQPWRHGEAERFYGLEIDHQFKFSRLQDWQVSGLGALENLTGINAGLPISIQ
jgi:hypothetical protein